MVWCPMITAQYVITQRLVGRAIPDDHADGLARYFLGTRAAGGGWGLHPEADGSVFVTALTYVALRLLGLGRDETALKDAIRERLRKSKARSYDAWLERDEPKTATQFVQIRPLEEVLA